MKTHLSQLGVTPSSAIQMFYSQIVLKQGLPFNLQLPYKTPTAIGNKNQNELDLELMKDIESLKDCKAYTADEIDTALSKEFGEKEKLGKNRKTKEKKEKQ